MLGIHDYWLFVAAGVFLNLTPGQDTLYILGSSIAYGRRIGLASALGISAGCIVHTLAAALGLSAILATSATAFIAVKLAGAAYLLCLGLTFVATGTLWCLCLAVAASHIRGFFVEHPRALTHLGRASGMLFVFLGLRLAAS